MTPLTEENKSKQPSRRSISLRSRSGHQVERSVKGDTLIPGSPLYSLGLSPKHIRLYQSNCIKVALKSSRIVVPELLGHSLLPKESNC